MRLVLYIGMHGAGAAAIQELLKSSHRALLSQGILYPRRGRRADGAHHMLWHALTSPLSTSEYLDKICVEAERAPYDIDTVLLASDKLESLCLHPKRQAGLDTLLKTFHHIVVVYIVRNQVDALHSLYRSRIEDDDQRLSISPQAFIKNNRSKLFYSKYTDFWTNIAPTLTLKVGRYHDNWPQLAARFSSMAEIPIVSAEAVGSDIREMDGAQLRIKHWLNSNVSPELIDFPVIEFLSKNFPNTPLVNLFRSDEELHTFQQQYADDNQKLARRFGVTGLDDMRSKGTLFQTAGPPLLQKFARALRADETTSASALLDVLPGRAAASAARGPKSDPPSSPAPPPPSSTKVAASPAKPQPEGARKKAAVVCWDLGHNPAGRAIVPYDLLEGDWQVDLIGPLWERFGGEVWGPIRDSGRRLKTFPCKSFLEFYPAALAIAENSEYDLVVVVKPRLPGLLLGAMIKARCGCPLVLDVDDFELSFFKNDTDATLDALEDAGLGALYEPYEELATRACNAIVHGADALTVSNVALKRRYGGYIVRHARHEETFDADRYDREAERARMGMAPEDFSIVFVGTPRPHKGVFQVCKTLADLPDKRFVFHIVGEIRDKRVARAFAEYSGARIVFHPGCAFEELPAKLAAADAIALLQDPDHPISQYQIPAKISDAAAFDIPIITTDIPPLRDIAEQGLFEPIAPENLGDRLKQLIRIRDEGASPCPHRSTRTIFETEFGFGINRERLARAIAHAQKAPAELPQSFKRLLQIAKQAYIKAPISTRTLPLATICRRKSHTGIDLVMFWKQNDAGLFGRRVDMLMKHLLESGRIRKILRFDAPLNAQVVAALPFASDTPDSAKMKVLSNTVANQFGLNDGGNQIFRTFIWRRPKEEGRAVLPIQTANLSNYPDFVATEIEKAGMNPEETIAWVCPVVFDFPAINAKVPFKFVIGDLIDDQREFNMKIEFKRRVIESYEATLPLFDLTVTNCDPVAEAFQPLVRRPIHVVPNGTELPTEGGPAPDAMREVDRPLIGYVGNLRDRIDWSLLSECAKRLPQATFMIIGDGALPEDIESIKSLKNVVFTGLVPYDQIHSYMREFDVAIVPHVVTGLTSRMNPLKIYNYFACDVPIVSTDVMNIDPQMRPFIRFASEPDSFVDAIEDALANSVVHDDQYDAVLRTITWDTRVSSIVKLIDGLYAGAA